MLKEANLRVNTTIEDAWMKFYQIMKNPDFKFKFESLILWRKNKLILDLHHLTWKEVHPEEWLLEWKAQDQEVSASLSIETSVPTTKEETWVQTVLQTIEVTLRHSDPNVEDVEK